MPLQQPEEKLMAGSARCLGEVHSIAAHSAFSASCAWHLCLQGSGSPLVPLAGLLMALVCDIVGAFWPAPSSSVSVVDDTTLPCLDMEPSWSVGGDLTFGVHLKPNQALKHLSQGSEHTPGTFSAIPHGAVGRLAKLTAAAKESENKPINLLHPKHAEALWKRPVSTLKSAQL